jgi:two-component system alkaline phosphatase synthesis response regulator PhoP
MSARILLVEDDAGVAMVIEDLLVGRGYGVTRVADGLDGLRHAGDTEFDLLILDVMLPGLDGYALCDRVRQQGFDGAILMLTARAQIRDRVHGLQRGADDYVVKPFDSDELLARVQALLRRVQKETLTPVTRFSFGSVAVDVAAEVVTRSGARVPLTDKEFQLLRYFINHRGQVLSRNRILQAVWRQQPFITARTVDVHVAWLRQKLEDIPGAPRHILTVRGEGYRFQPQPKGG